MTDYKGRKLLDELGISKKDIARINELYFYPQVMYYLRFVIFPLNNDIIV